MKNTLMKYTPIYVQGYIKRALELGFIKEKDIEHVKKKTNDIIAKTEYSSLKNVIVLNFLPFLTFALLNMLFEVSQM